MYDPNYRHPSHPGKKGIHVYSDKYDCRFAEEVPSVSYRNERKCPIYVHNYGKIPNDTNFLLNESKHQSFENKDISYHQNKIHMTKTSKNVLDKLEETYWATWKPKKESRELERFKNSNVVKAKSMSTKKDESYGDTEECILKYLTPQNIENNTVSDSDYAENEAKVTNVQNDNEVTPQILEYEETVKDGFDKIEETLLESQISVDEENSQEKENDDEEIKEIKHNDSFLLTKIRQEEAAKREHFQQPKCIRLYKKPASSASYLKGGTYPLKSCLKKDTGGRGSFRLGPPGKPLFITTTSSFNRRRK